MTVLDVSTLSNQNVDYNHYLKWYYVLFSLHKFGCNCYLFQKIAIYNDERQINDNVR